MTAAALPLAIRPRVAQLVRLLGSDQDGEVVAAARAIGQTLTNAGVDLHLLAAAIANPPDPIIVRQTEAVPGTSRRASSFRQRQAEKLSRTAVDPQSNLTRWERDFIASNVPALRSDADLSEKQTATLKRVLSKIRRRS